MRIRLVICAAAAALSASCLPVPFDLGLSQSAAAVKKMTLDNSALITLSGGTDPSAHDFAFYPALTAAGLDYSNGFVLSQRNLDVSLSLVQQSGSSYTSFTQQSWTIANPDPHMPPYVAGPMQTGLSYLFLMTFDAVLNTTASPFNANQYMGIWGDPAAHAITILNSPNTRMFDLVSSDPGIFNMAVVGASIYAGSAGNDTMHWLGLQMPSSSAYIELSYTFNSGGLGGSVKPHGLAWYGLPFIPSGITRCSYFYDENQGADASRFPNRSFASWWDASSGTWICYAWEGPPAFPPVMNKQLPINHRLDALLSTGQLFSTEGGTGRLYDRDGNLLATFPLGSLVYIGEHYVGGVPRCYFSQSLVFDRTQHFNVYWIQTNQLSTLAN